MDKDVFLQRNVIVLDAPPSANGFTWYQIRLDAESVEGWAADGDGANR